MNQLYRIYYQILREEVRVTPENNHGLGVPPFIPRREEIDRYFIDVEATVDLDKITAILGVGGAVRTPVQSPLRQCVIHLEDGKIELKDMPYGDFRALMDTWNGWRSAKVNTQEWRKDSSDAIWEDF